MRRCDKSCILTGLVFACCLIAPGTLGIRPSLLAQVQDGRSPSNPSLKGRGRIAGVVVDGSSKNPVGAVAVRLVAPTGKDGGEYLTEQTGSFSFENLVGPASYSIRLRKDGFFDAQYPDTGLGAVVPSLSLEEGESVTGLSLPMWRKSAIGGEVRLSDGQPLKGVMVSVLPVFMMNGKTRVAPGPMEITNDRGSYRIVGLAGGRYKVAMYPRAGSTPVGVDKREPNAYGRQFFPGVESLGEAQVIDIAPGDERVDVDFLAAATVPVRISGRVEGPSSAYSNLVVRLVTRGSETLGRDHNVGTSRIGQDGAFRIDHVPPGHYTLEAVRAVPFLIYSVGNGARVFGKGVTWDDLVVPRGPGPGERVPTPNVARYFGSIQLEVGQRDLEDVTLPLRRSAAAKGNLVFDTASASLPVGRVAIYAEPSDGDVTAGLPHGEVDFGDPTLPFIIDGLLPGVFTLQLQAPRGFALKSITYNGMDRTYATFDFRAGIDLSGLLVTLTDKTAALFGTLRYREVKVSGTLRAPGCAVILPVERSEWSEFGLFSSRIRTEAADRFGAFRIEDLPAGDYYLAALEVCPSGDFKEREFLDGLVRDAQRVSLSWGDSKRVDLEVEKKR